MLTINRVLLIKLAVVWLCICMPQSGWCLSTTSDRLMEASNKFERDVILNKLVIGTENQYEYLHSILSKLAPQSANQYRINIIKSPIANAYALPNGLIGVNTGLLTAVDNEAQLAMILAHEISHIELNHSVRLREDYNNSGFITSIPLLGGAIGEAIYNDYSQSNEKEADIEGLRMIAEAGYDSNESIAAYYQLMEFNGLWEQRTYNKSNTHPKTTSRIEYLNNQPSSSQGFIGAEVFQSTFLDIRVSQFKAALERRQFDWVIGRTENLTKNANSPIWSFFKTEAFRQRGLDGDLASASSVLEKSMKDSPNYLPLYYSKALLHLSDKQFEQAKTAFEKFLQLNDSTLSKEQSYAKFYIIQINQQLNNLD